MSQVTVTIPLSGALNLITLVQTRMKEIDKLQAEFPDLPMRDPATWESYRDTLYQLVRETDRVQRVAQ